MAPLDKIPTIWKNIQEVDLRPIRKEAEQRTFIALVGSSESELQSLAMQFAKDETGELTLGTPSIFLLDKDNVEEIVPADLVILLLPAELPDVKKQKELVGKWIAAGKRVIVFYPRELDPKGQTYTALVDWGTARVIFGHIADRESLQKTLVPAIMALMPDRLLSLGRNYPLMRIPIAQQLINDICLSNAVYALSTGIAEIVPALDIPLNITDIFVLTKAQALLVYRLGLLLGLPTDWRYYVGEFGSVIGSGFLWRQAARQLVGLIPIWGIIPKVAVSYAGTYVVGHAVMRWYQTGRHTTRKELGELYRQAFAQGKIIARNLAGKIPRPRLPKIRLRKRRALPNPMEDVACAVCNARNDVDANYCKNCGEQLVGHGGPTG